MSPLPDNALSDDELSLLATDVANVIIEAEKLCAEAVSLFDFGCARGLLWTLYHLDKIEDSEPDRAYKQCYYRLPQRILDEIDKLPPEHRSDLGKGVVVPAPLSTREKR